ncbi:MAG: DEAD/DEAH box helicase [Bacteroidales bacterium]|nr:DEAD/DEAH box helicase [Bacteroidales bacterium]
MTFNELDLDEGVLDALSFMHYGECTPVQEQAIPPVLAGDDVIAVAQTGTGKTAAYLLPILSNLNRYRYPDDAINCVIMAPTRELAQQIDQQMQGFSYYVDASSVAVYGGGEGRDFAEQQRGLQRGADVVIATPGRLLAHINLGYVDLSQVAFFVLDEADRMLDMGFYDDIMAIAKLLPNDCQKILYSATMPPKTQRLAEAIMWHPTMVKIAVSKPADKIRQQACICYEPQKTEMVIRVLKQFFGGKPDGFVKDELLHNPDRRAVVFVSKKVKVKDVVISLRKKGFLVAAMHSDLEQRDREETINAFKAGRVNVLVATDIVSRGIDISGIQLVINFDMTHDPEDYVHRVGRTARADADGESVTFVSANDHREIQKFVELERFLEKTLERIPVPASMGGCDEAEVMANVGRGGRGGRGQRGPRGARSPRDAKGPRGDKSSSSAKRTRSGKRPSAANGPEGEKSPEDAKSSSSAKRTRSGRRPSAAKGPKGDNPTSAAPQPAQSEPKGEN